MHLTPYKATSVKTPRAQPHPEAIVHQHLHPIGALVGEEICVVCSREAKYPYHPGQSWFHFVGCNRAGKPIAQHKFNRGQLMQFISNLPPCLIGMEACPGSQHLARSFQRHGHDVRLIAPKFIKPYVKSQKNDFNDAKQSPRR
jgi:hypothetical protein